jgi:Flp pilus assembly protein TadD
LARVAAETSDSAEAERVLRKALALDIYCGMAHNNLGTLLLERGELYEAANEFEWAKKLMPGHPSPRMNLALTLERAGRTGEALDEYRTALEVYPGHIQTMQAMSRLQVKSGQEDEATGGMLQEIAMRGDTPQWREWAALRLSRRDR